MWEDSSNFEPFYRLVSALVPDLDSLADLRVSDLKFILNQWILKNGSDATYGTLVHILDNQQFTEIVGKLNFHAIRIIILHGTYFFTTN